MFGNPLCALAYLYLIAIFGRIILSWFPLEPGGAAASVFRFHFAITEPVLGPVRNVLPSIGMFDLSPIVVMIGIQVLMQVIQRSL